MISIYTFEYVFYPDYSKVEDSDAFFDGVLSEFLSVLSNHGQIIDQHWNLIECGEAIKLICITIDEDSLDSKYYNIYGEKYLDKLISQSTRPPIYKLLGKTLGMMECCKCPNPSYYVFYPSEYASIICGDCDLHIPLYKIPKFDGEEEYYFLRSWEASYQCCDRLFMNTDVGEKYGYQQLSMSNSKLSLEGMKLCKSLSANTGKPCYYFLKKYYTKQKDDCPICKKNWKLEQRLHNFYSHRCDNCFIISEAGNKY
jgi:predicted  nucleic acid-binding Zn ribbon protein